MEKQPVPSVNEVYYSTDDEIDLFELWNGLMEEKKTVFVSFVVVFVLAVVYLLFTKPQYQASAKLQVQQIALPVEDSSNIPSPYMSVERAEKTVQLLSGMVSADMSSGKTVQQDNGYIVISATGRDKQKIKQNVQETIGVIEKRYQQLFSKLKTLGYVEILPTKVIGRVDISDNPVKPKKTLILAVAGVLGLMLGVFIALIRRAAKKRRAKMAVS